MGRDLQLAADVPFSRGDRIDTFELCDATTVLTPKELDLSLELQYPHALTWLEDAVLFEQLLDSDLTFKSLSFRDPRDGYIGGFRLTDEALLQDLEREPFFQLHSCCAENGSDRSCCSALLPDDFTEVGLSNS
jgi:hypothetical protein